MGQQMPVATTPTSADIHSYIKDMVVELAAMANRAGYADLARRLDEAIQQPRLLAWPEINKSPPDLRL